MLKKAEMAKGGEIFIFKMPALRIGDLAEGMIEDLAPKYGQNRNEIKIEIIGRRAGEKLYEELMTEDEATDAYEDEEMFVVLPQTIDIVGVANYRISYRIISKKHKRENILLKVKV